MSVHSNILGHGTVTSAVPATFYTTPTGKRTIVKNILTQNTNAAANRLQVTLKDAGGVTIATFNIYGAAVNTSGDTVNLLPWIVLPAGYLLQMAAAASGFQVVISGTELVL